MPPRLLQPQLPRDHLRRLEVGLEDRVVEAAAADEAAGVDVDRGERLGLVDDQVAAALEIHAPRQRLLDLLLDVAGVEQRPVALVVLEPVDDCRRVLLREFLHARERLARVDDDARGLVDRHVAQHALREAQVLVEQRRRRHFARAGREVAPQLGQVFDVRGHLAVRGGLGHRADDEAAGEPLGQQRLQLAAQELPLGLVLDALRDADVRVLRQVDEQASGEAHLGRQARPLGADRVLDHLHEQRLALVEDALDRPLAAVAVLPVLPDVGDVQERGPLETDLEEGALHARQHAGDPAEVDVADQPARARPLDVELLHHALLEHRDARFLGGYVDEDLMGHRGGWVRCMGSRRELGSDPDFENWGRTPIPDPNFRPTRSFARRQLGNRGLTEIGPTRFGEMGV